MPSSSDPNDVPPSRSENPAPVTLRRVAVVVNGRAKNVTADVISTLDRILEGSDLFVSRNLDDARDIAKTLVVRGYDTVLTGGGDGTFTVMVTEVVREVRKHGGTVPRFGLLKLGTGNALAWVVGARDVEGRELGADIRRLCEQAGSRPVRFVEAEGIISPFCGFGADAHVLADYSAVKSRLGRTMLKGISGGIPAYAIAAATRTLPSLLLSKMTHCRITNLGGAAVRVGARGSAEGRPYAAGEVLYDGPMRLCALSAIPYYGYGFRMFPYAEERPDRMQLRVTTISPTEFIRHLREIWRGEYENPKLLFDFLVDKVAIELEPPAPFQIGGDPRGDRSKVIVELSPTPIELVDFYAPPRAEGD
ncbi:MAG TPA: diacylglycerol kinase family protein [Polyangiaceae bacterium]|nr:diacylglycerol kinase family protein [Polyangiaceae bacterium]